MEIQGKETFIGTIKKALGVSRIDSRDRSTLFGGKGQKKASQDIAKIKGRTRRKRLELLDKLTEEARPLNINIIRAKDTYEAGSSICQLIKDTSTFDGNKKSVVTWDSTLIHQLELPHLLTQLEIPVYTTMLSDEVNEPGIRSKQRKEIRKQLIDSCIGITTADYCIAEAATLVMKTRPGQARAVSLIPSTHICVIELNQLIADVEELYTILKYDETEKEEGLTNVMTMISGPSKTADIELVMVHGAHGPRELHLFVITG